MHSPMYKDIKNMCEYLNSGYVWISLCLYLNFVVFFQVVCNTYGLLL